MISSRLLLFLTLSCSIFLQLTWSVNAACVCNEKGTDFCSNQKCDDRRIVRPKPRYIPPSPGIHIPPIGDNCWCNKFLIEPAALPKTCHKTKKPPKTCGCINPPLPPTPPKGCVENVLYPTNPYTPSYTVPHVDYAAVKPPQDDSPPADPISIALAIQQGNAIAVPEAKLSYGFVKNPIDGLKKIYFSDVPEENLFKLNNEVITLKKASTNSQKEEEEEWMLDLEEEEDGLADDTDDNERPQLTYKQLGYITEQYKNPKFRQIHSSYGKAKYDDDYDRHVPGKVSVDCGFRPGRIARLRKKKTKKSNCDGGCHKY